jgi:hypothetical protein
VTTLITKTAESHNLISTFMIRRKGQGENYMHITWYRDQIKGSVAVIMALRNSYALRYGNITQEYTYTVNLDRRHPVV